MQSSSTCKEEEDQKVSKNIINELRCLCISKNISQEQESSRQINTKRSNQTKLQQYQPNRCMFFASENERNNCSQEAKGINSSTNEGDLHPVTDNLILRSISMKSTYDHCSQPHPLKKSQKQLDKSKDHLEVCNDGIMSQQDNALTYKKPGEHVWQSYFFSDSVNPNENQLKNQRSSQDNLPKRRSSMLKNLAHNGTTIHSVTCSPSLSPSKGIQNLKSKGIPQSQVLAKSAYLNKNTRSQSTKGNKNFSKEKRNTAHCCLDFLKELNELKVFPVKQNQNSIRQQDSRQLTSQQKKYQLQQEEKESDQMKGKETNLRIGIPRLVVNETNKSKPTCSKLRTQKEWRTLINDMVKKQKPFMHRENPVNISSSMEDLLKTQKTQMKNMPYEKNLRLTPKKNPLFSKFLESTSLHVQETRDVSESGSQYSITPSQKNQGSESGSSTQRNYNTSVLNKAKLSDMIEQQKQMEQLLTPRGQEQTESEKKRNCQNGQSKNEVRASSEEKVLAADKSSRCSRRKGEDGLSGGLFMPKYFNSQEQQSFSPAKEIKETHEEGKIKRKFIISTPIGQNSEGRTGQNGKSIFTENNNRKESEIQLRSLQGDYYYNQQLHNRNALEKARFTLFSNWFAERDKTNKSCHNNTTSDAADKDQGLMNNCEFFPDNEGSETSNNNNLSNAKISSMTSEESARCRTTLTSTADLSSVERVNTEPARKNKKKVVVVVNSSVMQQVSTPRIIQQSNDVSRNKDKDNSNAKNNSVHSERVSFNQNVKSSPHILLSESHTARHFESHGSVCSQHSSSSKNEERKTIENNLNQNDCDLSDGLQTWDLCQDYWVIDRKEFKSNASLGYANARQELLLAKKSDWSLWEAIEKPRRQKVLKIKSIQQKDTKSQSLMDTGSEREPQCIIDHNLIGLTTMEINTFEALQAEIRAYQANNKCKKVLAGQLFQNSKTVGVVREWECYGNLSEMLSVSGLLNEKIISVIFKNFLQILIETIRETGWMVRLDHCAIHFDANCQVILGLNIGTAMNVDLSFLQYISNIHQAQFSFEIESLQHLEQKSQMVSQDQEVISSVGQEDQQIHKSDSSAPEHSQMQGSSQESMRNFMANGRKYNTKSDENISATTERGLSVSKTCLLGEEDLVFELGFIILKSLIGQEYVLFNRNYFFANTLGPAFSKNLKENLLKKSSNCCFFHDLKKTVQSSDVNAFIDLKRAKELCSFLEKNCSESLLKLLCGSMKYKKTERMTLEKMKEMLDSGSETISQQKQTIVLRHLFEQLRIKQSLSQRNSENHLKHEKTLMRIAKTLQNNSGGEKSDLAGKIARQIAIKFYMHTNEVLQVLSEKS